MRDPDRTGKDTCASLVLLPKVPAFPSRGWCSCLTELEKITPSEDRSHYLGR